MRNLASADTAGSHNSTVANSPDSESLDRSEEDSTKQVERYDLATMFLDCFALAFSVLRWLP